MSDVAGSRENLETQTNLDAAETNTAVPHTGNFPEGHPFREEPPKNTDGADRFDQTDLGEAAAEYISTPEHPGALIDTNQDSEAGKNRTKLMMFIGGGIFALAAAGAGFLAGKDSGSEPVKIFDPVEDAVPSTTEALPDDIDVTTTVPETIDQEGAARVVIADSLKPGEDFITATRANGEEIRVPKLRDTDDLNAFGESALALMACYLSTGSQECLDEFTTSDAVKEYMATYRQDVVVEPYAEYTGMRSHGNFQMVIYDEPSAPAEFTRSNTESGFIVSSGGPIYFQVSDADEWQGLNSSSDWYGQVTERLEFRTAVQSDGSTDIIGMRFHLNLR